MSNRLYFSVPNKFNDPYDNLIFANSAKIVGDILGRINTGMEDYLKKAKTNGMKWVQLMEFMWSNDISKEKMLQEHCKRIYSALDAVRTNIRCNSKVICFSERYDSMLMWSHYADYHRGFILVFKKEDLKQAERFDESNNAINAKTFLSSVRYVEAQIDMTDPIEEYIRNNMFETMGDVVQPDSTISSKMIREVILEKAKDWEYEREWRLVPRVPKLEKKSELHYIICRPIAVVVGSRCQGRQRERLIDICKKINVPIYGIYLSETSPQFRLTINEEGGMEIAEPEYLFIYNE